MTGLGLWEKTEILLSFPFFLLVCLFVLVGVTRGGWSLELVGWFVCLLVGWLMVGFSQLAN